ncbi:uncharacterized protein PV09_01947 [Verruconis gallopava]|uniref:ferric-chelate reductase (NADPH) n=1 Tax=Verruconis gallopava TaxID=253628 RepID=A0A0D1XWE2_9PEZI|nr:uncharacterized protein PV09_01947 [Verruconis gallopava]KIW07056.1 hypothetical protein PV09_01947 [Verruconis gallopava]
MSAAWLTPPVQLTGMRMFECGDLTAEQCSYYKERWHFWYIADYVFALPTVAFFMSAIGIFIIGYGASLLLHITRVSEKAFVGRRLVAAVRYLSYRGFHIRKLNWNSAPVGVLSLGFAGTIFFFCMDLAPKPYYWSDEIYGGSPPLATRSGWMALGCMPFVFATASKTNWITLCTGVSHERLQVFHRWIAYAFFILALLHTFPFIVYHIHWHDMEAHFSESLLFYWTGIVAIIFQAWLTFASHSTIRKLGYEFFKLTHFLAVVVFVVTFFWHCDYTLTSWHYFIATAAIYVPCYVYPWIRTGFQYGMIQQAQIAVEDNGFTRIKIPAKFTWKPGQHCFLRFTSFGLAAALSSHPFTICSSPPFTSDEKPELVFYIRHQRGFTEKLYRHALENPNNSVPVLVDGPYGGINAGTYHEADHHLVIAGGSGAGWCLPFIEHFLRSSFSVGDEEHANELPHVGTKEAISVIHEKGQVLGKAVTLRVILATRDVSSRLWFLSTVEALFSKYGATNSASHISVQVYLTGTAADEAIPTKEVSKDSESCSQGSNSPADRINVPVVGQQAITLGAETKGRPPLRTIIHEEACKAAKARESLNVFVCGPTTMQNDVRNAVAYENLEIIKGSKAKAVYLHSEHFSWA